jgi:hypothetical protein
MLVIHGVYHWRPKPVAFRNDYCIRCGAERVAIQVRTIDVFHVFFVPLLPLGLYKRWRCLQCGNPPSLPRATGVRQSVKVFVLLGTLAMAVPVWLPSKMTSRGDLIGLWIGRFVVLIPALLVVRWLKRGSVDVERRERLKSIRPSDATICPLCRIPLLLMEPARCHKCGIVRLRPEVVN